MFKNLYAHNVKKLIMLIKFFILNMNISLSSAVFLICFFVICFISCFHFLIFSFLCLCVL